jgi:hypothetical protein
MSPRELAQENIRHTLMDLELNQVYGILEGKGVTPNGKTYRSLTFCQAETLDGEVKIFGPKFIVVRYKTAIRRLPHEGYEQFASVEECQKWLIETFGVIHA